MACIAQALKALLPALLCFALPAALAAQNAPRDRDLDRIPPLPLQAPAAGAARMMALVIGNSNYSARRDRLPNAANDAKDIAAALNALEQHGVAVELHLDLDFREMTDKISDFYKRLKTSGSVGFFYYAGHGIQHEGENYLIPLDANIRDVTQIKYQAIAVDDVLGDMSKAGNPLNVLVLDACRNNPFDLPFEVEPGFAEVNRTQGNMIIAYSTAAGATASDGGTGGNSPYTRHLKAAIEQTSGIPLQDMFGLVQTNVAHETRNRQEPFLITASSPYGFYLVPTGEGALIKQQYIVERPKIERVIPGPYLLAALAAVAIIPVLVVYAKAQSQSPIALTPDNLGAQHNPDAQAYLCDGKTGRPLNAVTKGSCLVIGRANDAGVKPDIPLQDDRISARHAELSCTEEGEFFITDLNSTNGTYVQGQRLAAYQRTRLSPTGDFYLALAQYAFILRPAEP